MINMQQIKRRLDALVPGGLAVVATTDHDAVEIWHAIDNTTVCELRGTQEERQTYGEFIAHAPDDVLGLLNENSKLRSLLNAALEVLEEISDIRLMPYTDDDGAVEMARDFLYASLRKEWVIDPTAKAGGFSRAFGEGCHSPHG